MARTKVPQAEGVDREVEGVDFPVQYVELPKPEVTEVREDPLEGYHPRADIREREQLLKFTKQEAKARADVLGNSVWVLWNSETGAVYLTEHKPLPWQALAQREMGFTRYVGHARQESGGIMTTDGGPGYYTTVDVRPDHSFDHEADYLATPDQLSEPFTEKLAGSADEAFCHDLLDAVSRKTATDDRFEQALLQRPDVRIGSLSKAVRIGGEDDEMLDVLKQLAEMEDSPLPKGPFASKAVGEEEVGLGEFRGAITSIPELAGNDWAIVQTGDRRGGTKELMESVAARIGHGSRVYVEGVSGQAKVLVPIKLGFAG